MCVVAWRTAPARAQRDKHKVCCLPWTDCLLFSLEDCLCCCLARHARAGAARRASKLKPLFLLDYHMFVTSFVMMLSLLAWLASCLLLWIACVVAWRAAPARARRAKHQSCKPLLCSYHVFVAALSCIYCLACLLLVFL